MINRHNTADSFSERPTRDFGKIKVGKKSLSDAIYRDNTVKKVYKAISKDKVLEAIYKNDYAQMREFSDFYFKVSGIYSRLCKYLADLYRYDWMITPLYPQNTFAEENKSKDKNKDKMISQYNDAIRVLDKFGAKLFFSNVALSVVKSGCYYGYLVESASGVAMQELPIPYCRSRFSVNGRPVVEFYMKYFDDQFSDSEQRARMLELFPKDFKKGYKEYKAGHLLPTFKGDQAGWYLLDPELSFKFNIGGVDHPMFISTIPALLDLEDAKDLDKDRMTQQLLKIIVQKLPLDKNGELIFDTDEAAVLHSNAVRMLGNAIGVDVLTTFAEVAVEDMYTSMTSNTDELEKVERSVYNEAGVSQMQFNTDGNIALEKSILNDEASLSSLIRQFEQLLNTIIRNFNKNPKKWSFNVQILSTTIYNYKDMAKLYKEQTQIGYSKLLPQIALGHSQSAVLSNAYFENQLLSLTEVFIPPAMSSTTSLATTTSGGSENGRPEKDDDEKSEKTIQNEESKN